MLKTIAVASLAAFLLSGCTTWEVGKAAIDKHGANAADEVLLAAEFSYCRATTIGAVMRAFRGRPQQFQAYMVLCQDHWVDK